MILVTGIWGHVRGHTLGQSSFDWEKITDEINEAATSTLLLIKLLLLLMVHNWDFESAGDEIK